MIHNAILKKLKTLIFFFTNPSALLPSISLVEGYLASHRLASNLEVGGIIKSL